MSKSIYLLPILFILAIFSCTSNNEDMEVEQDYTSFVVSSESDNVLINTVVGYKRPDNTYKKIAEIGDIKSGMSSKEIRILDDINEIYIFGFVVSMVRLDDQYKIEKNKKNLIVLKKNTRGIGVVDVTNPLEYPQ